MDRNDWLWVFTKAFGVYLGAEGILRLPSCLMIFTSIPKSWEGTLAAWNLALYLILSIYLLKSGRLIFRLVDGR
jgi:hypothetical protein